MTQRLPRAEVRTLATTVHGRYLTSGPAGPAPLLIGFHGYGEDAERHLAALETIPGIDEWRRVAVDALHPFYERKSGEVVGSWMTKRDRELAIADNVRYAAAVVTAVRGEWPTTGPLVYAGFSQGVAMAFRAAAGAGHPCHGVVALGGDIPPELAARTDLALPPVLLGRGLADEQYGAAQADEDLGLLRAKGIEARLERFAGGHAWTPEFSAAVGTFLASLLASGR